MVMVIDSMTKNSIFKNWFCSELIYIRNIKKQFTQELGWISQISFNWIKDTIIRNTLLFTLSKSGWQNELYGQNKILGVFAHWAATLWYVAVSMTAALTGRSQCPVGPPAGRPPARTWKARTMGRNASLSRAEVSWSQYGSAQYLYHINVNRQIPSLHMTSLNKSLLKFGLRSPCGAYRL